MFLPLLANQAVANSATDNGLTFHFDIPRQRADEALTAFGQQADITVLYQYDFVKAYDTKQLRGNYTVSKAVAILLEYTGLRAEFDQAGHLIITVGNRGKNEMKSKISLLPMVIVFWSAFGGGAVDAVEPDSVSEQSATIEEVIVTARKRAENLQEVPISISAFSAKDLEAMSLTSLKELGQFTPNFSFSNHGSTGRYSSIIYIRGVGQSDPSAYKDPGVGIYIDGVYMARGQGVNLDLMDLERVEILRGPQGTLFGRNTIGGAVNIVTVKPVDEFKGSVGITVGRFDRFDVKAIVNVPLIPGKLAAKFAAVTRNQDGYGTRLDFFTGDKIGEMGDTGSKSGRAMFKWTPSENVDALLSFDATRARELGPVRKIVAFNNQIGGLIGLFNSFVDPDFGDTFQTDTNFSNYGNGPNVTELDAWGAALTVDWDLGGWGLKSITSYRDSEALNGVDADGSIYTIISAQHTTEQNQFSQEFQLSGLALEDRLSWVAGLFYFEEDGLMVSKTDVARELKDIIGLDLSSTRPIWSTSTSYATFGQLTYNATDKLSLTGGLRYTYEEKEVERTEFFHYSGIVRVPLESRSESWDAVSGRIGFEYQWNDGIMSYISAARGFKSGGINGTARSSSALLSYLPEYMWTYEVGLRTDLFERRLRFNATLFYSDYEDIQFRISTADPETLLPIIIVGNAAKARIQGFELEAIAVPVTGLTLTAGVGLTDAKYTEVDPALPITESTKFEKTPKWSTTFSGQYAVPLDNLGVLTGRVDYVYKSKIYHNETNSLLNLQKGYGLLNARLTFERNRGSWAISLYGTNLTDENYILAGTDFFSGLGFADVQYAHPREWGVNLEYSF